MKTKRILEQDTPAFVSKSETTPTPVENKIDLKQAIKEGCFNLYEWFTIDSRSQPVDLEDGSGKVVVGKNKKNEEIFFDELGKVTNNVTTDSTEWKCEAYSPQTKNLFLNFNISGDDENEIKETTKILQDYITSGKAVSDVFKKWNQMLSVHFPKSTRLTGTFNLPYSDELDTNYIQVPNLNRHGWRNIIIYVSQSTQPKLVTQKKIELTNADCHTKLKEYFNSALQASAGVSSKMANNTIQLYKKDIQQCASGNKYNDFTPLKSTDITELSPKLSPFGTFEKKLNFNNIKQILSGQKFNGVEYLKTQNGFPYIFTIKTSYNESKLDNLSLLIKENLMISLNEKKKTILTENKIIKNRLNVLLEGGIPKTKTRQERLINEIINEAISLNSQGLDKDLIKENFWDTIKGLLGSHSERDLVEMFKEKYKTFIIKKLTNEKPDTWVSEIVNTSFETIPTSNYFNGKAFECGYITNVISKTLTQEMIKKTGKSFDDNTSADTVLDVVKKSVVNLIDDQAFIKNIEHGIAKFICPAIQGIPDKLDKAVEQMRDKALKP
jgi:hypothetical protein